VLLTVFRKARQVERAEVELCLLSDPHGHHRSRYVGFTAVTLSAPDDAASTLVNATSPTQSGRRARRGRL
jgi:hypothetical protein